MREFERLTERYFNDIVLATMLILVTFNVDHFNRFHGLRVESWW